MKRFLLFLGIGICMFIGSLSCAKADSLEADRDETHITPFYRESDLPVKFYGGTGFEDTFGISGKTIKMITEGWSTLPPEVGRKMEENFDFEGKMLSNYSYYTLGITRYYFRSNKEAMDWLKNDMPSNCQILGSGDPDVWWRSSFTKELTQELGCFCLGLKLPHERNVIVIKDNVIMRVDVLRKFSNADEKKIVRKSPQGEVLGDYVELDFIGLLRKLIPRL